MNGDTSSDCIPPDWVPLHQRPGGWDDHPTTTDHPAPTRAPGPRERNTPMSTTSADLAREIDRIRTDFNRRLDGLAANVEAATAPAVPEPGRTRATTVVTFTKRFGAEFGTPYEYVAIRPGGRSTWSVSGKDRSNLTSVPWKLVAAFILRDETGESAAAAVDSITQWGPR